MKIKNKIILIVEEFKLIWHNILLYIKTYNLYKFLGDILYYIYLYYTMNMLLTKYILIIQYVITYLLKNDMNTYIPITRQILFVILIILITIVVKFGIRIKNIIFK